MKLIAATIVILGSLTVAAIGTAWVGFFSAEIRRIEAKFDAPLAITAPTERYCRCCRQTNSSP